MTHLLIPYALGRSVGRPSKRPRSWLAVFCLGAVLPDLLTRAPAVAFPTSRWIGFLTAPLGTPAGLVVFCLGFAFLFAQDQRTRTFGWLMAGVGLHLALDLLQKGLGTTGYDWFFPVSWASPRLGLFWPDETVLILPLLAGLAVAAEIRARLRSRA